MRGLLGQLQESFILIREFSFERHFDVIPLFCLYRRIWYIRCTLISGFTAHESPRDYFL
jgi:hypothetical protein